MAIWQFSIDFIPRKNLIQRFGEIPNAIDDEILWKENLEEGVNLPKDFETFLNRLGQKEILEWRMNSYNWGDYDDGTHITIECNDKNKSSVYCRFNVGEMELNFVKIVLEFAKICNCVLLTKNENIIEPKLNLFIDELKKSNSYRFCNDPIEYLQSDEVKQINWSVKEKLKNIKFEDLTE